MATYTAVPDTYAGWQTGRQFGAFGLAAGAVGLAGAAAMHGWLPGLRPQHADAELFFTAMQWIGFGLCALMTFCVLGSMEISRKSRGSVTVDDVGVARQIGKRRQMLRWEEIEGFVPMSSGGVTLVPTSAAKPILIPRSLEEYRDCIAELKAHQLESLPADRLRRPPGFRTSFWHTAVRTFFFLLPWTLAFDASSPHPDRILGLAGVIAYATWEFLRAGQARNGSGSRSGVAIVFAGLLAWLLFQMARTW